MVNIKTISICEYCLRLVPAEIIEKDDNIVIKKKCFTPGCLGNTTTTTIIATDVSYFLYCVKEAQERITKNDERKRYNLCFLEVSNECDIKCVTCMANSGPGRGKIKSLDECKRLIGLIENMVYPPEILVLTGGEPAIHPNIFPILDHFIESRIPHCIFITNGIRIAYDIEFVKLLSKYRNRIEIYLQYDSSNPESLINIRGHDLKDVRSNALKNLQDFEISTTMVSVLKKGINISEISDMIKVGLSYQCVRGITFQPLRAFGRHEVVDKNDDVLNLTDVRNEIVNQKVFFSKEDLIPHPQSPLGICIGYLKRENTSVKPVTNLLFHDGSWSNSEDDYNKFRSSMFFQKEFDSKQYTYNSLFRVAIVSYLDKYSFLREQLNSCNFAFMTEKGKVIPFDTKYLEGEGYELTHL